MYQKIADKRLHILQDISYEYDIKSPFGFLQLQGTAGSHSLDCKIPVLELRLTVAIHYTHPKSVTITVM